MHVEHLPDTGEGQRLVRWRGEQPAAAGFPPPVAARLAHDPRGELHAVIELIGCGCSPQLAACILASLDLDDGHPS